MYRLYRCTNLQRFTAQKIFVDENKRNGDKPAKYKRDNKTIIITLKAVTEQVSFKMFVVVSSLSCLMLFCCC